MKQTLSLVALLAFLFSAACQAQSVFFSTRTQAATSGGPAGTFDPQEVLVFDSHLGAARHHATNTALNTLLGDANGDFVLADFNKSIDAVSVTGTPGPADSLGLLLSVDQSMKVLGSTILDGDIFRIGGQGQTTVVYNESLFANATQTTTIDVDAFHEEPDGTLYFSFANDETTTATTLTTANGGNSVLDESVVFRLAPGATSATLHFTRNDILGFVNNALGSSYSTIVDLTGFCADPDFPGEWLFCVGSTNSAIEGRIFSTALGGRLAQHFGLTLDSSSLGFTDEEVLEGLSWAPFDCNSFRLFGPGTTPAPAGSHAWSVAGATPWQLVQLFASNSLLPEPWTESLNGMAGYPLLYVNPSDPLFSLSVNSLDFSRYASVDGEATVSFATSHLPPGLRITMQAVDLATGRISMPASFGI